LKFNMKQFSLSNLIDHFSYCVCVCVCVHACVRAFNYLFFYCHKLYLRVSTDHRCEKLVSKLKRMCRLHNIMCPGYVRYWYVKRNRITQLGLDSAKPESQCTTNNLSGARYEENKPERTNFCQLQSPRSTLVKLWVGFIHCDFVPYYCK